MGSMCRLAIGNSNICHPAVYRNMYLNIFSGGEVVLDDRRSHGGCGVTIVTEIESKNVRK